MKSFSIVPQNCDNLFSYQAHSKSFCAVNKIPEKREGKTPQQKQRRINQNNLYCRCRLNLLGNY